MNNFVDIPISEIVAQTKHLELKARKLVNDSLQSDYKSLFRGRGMEFDEVRSYYPGDNIRDIDWNVTARMNEPFIKTYIEERQLLTYFIIDISASENFGSQQSKRRIMAEITALLGFTAFFANDRSGLVLFSDSIEKTIPPAHNYSHMLRIIRDVYYFSAKSKKTNINQTLRQVNNLLKKKAIIFLISDFFDTSYEHALGNLARKHEIIPIVVQDPIEKSLYTSSMFPIIAEIEDMESGQTMFADLSSEELNQYTNFSNQYKKIFKKLGLQYAEVSSEDDYVKIIDKLLRQHAKN